MKGYSVHNKKARQKSWISYSLLLILCVSFLVIPGTNAAYGQDRAKYIILMISDGWGPQHIEATNAYTGTMPPYQDPAWLPHWISTFPYGGSYDTTQAWTDFNYVMSGYTDSSAAPPALYSGNKTQNGRISVSYNASQRFFTIGEKSKSLGKAVGAVTTVPISDATPGAFCAHNDDTGNTYAIADECLFEDPNTTGTIANDPKYAGGHGPTTPSVDVIIGDGRGGYVNDAIRYKLRSESGTLGDPYRDTTKHYLVERQTGEDGGDALLQAASDDYVTKLAGLFDHIYRHDLTYSSENPTLAEITIAALTVLNKNPNGFVIMIEGGAVDWAGHANNMDLMIGEMIDFNEAVQAVIDWVDDPTNGSDWNNTLVIVTGDHETGYLTAGPGIFQNQPLGEVSDTTLALEKIINGSGGRRASWEDIDNNSVIDAGETVYWAWNTGGHTNTLIPLYARGVGADQLDDYAIGYDSVHGYYLDDTDVFSVLNSVIGNSPPTASNDSATTSEDTPVDINVIANDTDVDGTIDLATATITSPAGNGIAMANTNGTVTYTPNTGFTGTDSLKYTVKDNEGAKSNQATVTVTVRPAGEVFVAYNDLSWSTGQINNNITIYTTGQNGLLKDYITGINTPVTLNIAGGYIDATTRTQGSNANNGTNAYSVFNGIINGVGLISYSATNLTFTFTGLDPNLTYEFVLFGNRNEASYTNRLTTTAISDVAYFTNSSTPGADFSGPGDPSVTIVNGYNTNGYVARFTNINPGPDGDMRIAVSSDDGHFYANALMLRAINTYTVTGFAPGGHGTISCVPSTVNSGGSSTCTMTPDNQYHLSALTNNGTDVLGSVINNKYIINNVTADHTVVATFLIDTIIPQTNWTLLGEGTEWYYSKEQPPYKWTHIDFNGFDENWFIGRTGIGYGHRRVVTNLDDMRGKYQSIYARREITLNESTYRLLQQDSTKVTLSLICDGSFKIWLNGTELIRSNDMRTVPEQCFPQALDINITDFARELFLKGSNVLAIQCSNDNINSDNFLFIPNLRVEGQFNCKVSQDNVPLVVVGSDLDQNISSKNSFIRRSLLWLKDTVRWRKRQMERLGKCNPSVKGGV